MRDGWLTKTEAAELLGVSARTLERYAKAGRVESGFARGKYGPERLFLAESVEGLKAELAAPMSDVVIDEATTPAPSASLTTPAARPEHIERLFEALAALAQQPALLGAPPTRAPEVPIADRLTLGLADAAALSGFSRGYLLEAIHAGRLKAEKRAGKWNVKRKDLDAWVVKL